jgi:restriction endonuclease S subunit
LEGLEVSVLNLKDVLADNENIRIDSEYFRKQFLSFFKNVPNLKPLEFFVKDGYRVVYENTQIVEKDESIVNNYPYFLQATDLETPFIKTDNLFYVKGEDWIRYPKGRISRGEILIEVKGKIEKVSIVPDDFPEKTLVSRSLFKLTVNENISKHVLLCYLISKYGTAFKDRYKTNLLISYISKPDLYRIPIPEFSKDFQRSIDNKFESIFELKGQSQQLYRQAEELLLETIGLKDFKPSQEGKNIKSFKESFLSTGRLDAEYYQPKYEEIENVIKNSPTGYCKLKDIGQFKNGSLISDELYISKSKRAYLRIKELSYNQPIANNDVVFIDDNFIATNETVVNTDDFVFATIGNTIGKVNLITECYNNSFISNNTSRFRMKETKYCFFYELLFRSIAVQEQIQKEFTQTAQPKIGNESLENIIIPLVEEPKQQQIAALIEESFYLRRESERLLEEAKEMVEREIEKE